MVWPKVLSEEQGQTNRWRDKGTDSQLENALPARVGGSPNVSTADDTQRRCSARADLKETAFDILGSYSSIAPYPPLDCVYRAKIIFPLLL